MKAQRGDLVALVRITREYVIRQETTERTSVELAIVANITREGVVRKVRRIDAESISETAYEPSGNDQVLVISAAQVDGPALVEAYQQHRWESAPYPSVRPFDSLSDARAFVARFRRA